MADRDPESGKFVGVPQAVNSPNTPGVANYVAGVERMENEAIEAMPAAEAAAESAVEAAPAPEAAPEAAAAEEQVETYKVSVDGEDVEVPFDELRQGYMRQATFTKRMQELARQKEDAQRERELLERIYGRTGGGPEAEQTGTWQPDPLNFGGQRVSDADNPYAGYGQPPAPVAAPRSPAPPIQRPDPDDYVPYGEVEPLKRQVAALNSQFVQMRQAQQAQMAEQVADAQIAELARRLPGFDRTVVEERLALMPDGERRQLQLRMYKPEAYELLWRRHVAENPQAAKAKQTTTAQRPTPIAPPFSEGAKRAAAEPIGPPGPLTSHNPAVVADQYGQMLQRAKRL